MSCLRIVIEREMVMRRRMRMMMDRWMTDG